MYNDCAFRSECRLAGGGGGNGSEVNVVSSIKSSLESRLWIGLRLGFDLFNILENRVFELGKALYNIGYIMQFVVIVELNDGIEVKFINQPVLFLFLWAASPVIETFNLFLV